MSMANKLRYNCRLEIVYTGMHVELPTKAIYEADIILQKTKPGYCKVLKDRTGRLLRG